MTQSFLLALILLIIGCGGGSSGNDSEIDPSTGGGYSLRASGGTLNDGSGSTGLTVLATLRDSEGNGPGATAGWELTISGPGLTSPITVDYDDGSPSSYISWSWSDYVPTSGTYTVQASNGSVTLTYDFTIDASSILSRPSLSKIDDVISWQKVSGAGSYYYKIKDGNGWLLDTGYLSSDVTSFTLPSLSDGSYLVEVYAQSNSRISLQGDDSSAPGLLQDNISLSKYSFALSGSSTSYDMSVRGGVLYMGKDGTNTDHYGLVTWVSILASAGTPPAGDWTISVSGPGVTSPVQFTYPGGNSHYSYWEYSVVPQSGSYTVTATETTSGEILSAEFTISNPTSQLPVATGILVSPVSDGGTTVTWIPVYGAASYYVNVWTDISGTYTEVAGGWVNGNTAIIPTGTLTTGVDYDFYVTASTLDMTTMSSTPPPVPGEQVDMSDNTYQYVSITAGSPGFRAKFINNAGSADENMKRTGIRLKHQSLLQSASEVDF